MYTTGYDRPRRERKLNVGMLVFSIIVMIFFSPLFGILALLQTVSAHDQPTDELEAQKLRYAKIFNIIGIALTVVVCVLSIIFAIVLMTSGNSEYIDYFLY